ncbi:zinc finger bed domain-containing protein 1-like [Gigaspora margarita]|uniref:Zinc finger bed domain-containing protein 1-like n=1 Tax=Gigaspora margarita TaxID=4874 RepID=A0A8H4B1N0_GIGMA|nr:zinc finger bed domain-containing protein 1-like [Gigaspora margarita]
MQDIVNILGPFFEVTEVLGSSKYSTFSYIIPSILGLIEKLDCSMEDSDKSNYINFETTDLVFDDNVEFVDAQEEDEGSSKERKIKINAPIDVTNMQHKIKNVLYNALLHCWNLSDNELFLACLLDLRFKTLRFATSTQQLQAKAALREKYNNIKSLHQSSLTPINQSLDICEEQPLAENSRCQIYQKTFIKSIFTQNTINKPNNEISRYLSLPEVSYHYNPCYW